ncbi:Hypothetical predicted protein [Marmota monax]|uniref:Uncharacterized protein n=1 Tax=Marmota monax TaxID=9995 RepID=A0A5E4BY28_MARMO|nr:hypothetical protein GHT09_020068 [Marmota monax]VTJ74166.1 Hypothetical predicted protein [Marmota monax]
MLCHFFIQHLDKTLLTVSTLISQDERISSSPVAKIIYGDPASFLPQLPQKSVVHCSKIWSCRKKITVEYLQHVVEQKNGKEVVPVLWQFLQKEAELRLVKFLPEILALQRDLVKRFQNVPEDEYCSIRSFISSHSSEGLRQLFHNRITIFLSTWNALRRSLETNGEIKLPKDYYSSDLDLDTDFEVILPRRRGLGLCSTALVSYLINLQNDFIHTVEKFSKENNSYSVDASEATDLHVVSYEAERDLIPLIISNCQYQVEQGGETLQEFDLEKIQRQISSCFLQGKPRLTLKLVPRNHCADLPIPSSSNCHGRGFTSEYLAFGPAAQCQQHHFILVSCQNATTQGASVQAPLERGSQEPPPPASPQRVDSITWPPPHSPICHRGPAT